MKILLALLFLIPSLSWGNISNEEQTEVMEELREMLSKKKDIKIAKEKVQALFSSEQFLSALYNLQNDRLNCIANERYNKKTTFKDCLNVGEECSLNWFNNAKQYCEKMGEVYSSSNIFLIDEYPNGDGVNSKCVVEFMFKTSQLYPELVKATNDMIDTQEKICRAVELDNEEAWLDEQAKKREKEKIYQPEYIRVCRTYNERGGKNINTGEKIERRVTICDLERKKTQGEINRQGIGYLLDKLF